MATPAFFGNGFLQFKREAAWGTDLAATKRLPCTVLDVQAGVGAIRSNSMDGSRVRGAIYAGGHRARAVVEIEVQYITGTTDPSGLLMAHDAIFGTGTFGAEGFATTGPVASYYVHEFTIGSVMNSLLLELGDGSPGAAGTCVQMTGAKVVEAVWTWGASYEGDDNVLKLRLTFVGKTITTGVTPTGALTAQAIDPVLSSHCAVTDGYGGSTVWNNVSITYRTAILEDGHFIGSQYIREPVPSEFVTCEVEMTGDFDSYTQVNALLNHTATSAQLGFAFTKPGASDFYWLKFEAGKAYVVDAPHPLSSPGIVKQTIRLESIKHATNGAMIAQYNTKAPDTEG